MMAMSDVSAGEGPETSDESARPPRWAVVGGGMLGAVAAQRLRRDGAEVVLYESAPVLGGLTSAWQLPGARRARP